MPDKIRRIGVISSESGAVIHDIINVVTRRNNEIDIVLYPARVQGIDADKEVISGIKFFENYDVDVIVTPQYADISLIANNTERIFVFDETYISDIVGRHNIRNKAELEELLNILSSAIGSLTNPEKLSATFRSVKNKKISSNTIRKYIDYLCDSFLIDSAVRYDVKGKKYIDTPVKYYFTDMGLRNARLNFRQLEETHSMENIIFNELKIRGFNVDVGIIMQYETNEKGNSIRKQLEIDFVCNKGSKRYYIQSAYAIPDQAKMEQEQGYARLGQVTDKLLMKMAEAIDGEIELEARDYKALSSALKELGEVKERLEEGSGGKQEPLVVKLSGDLEELSR